MSDAHAVELLANEIARRGTGPLDVERLVDYVAAVVEENERINLTGAKTLAAAIEILAIDALPVATAWGRRPPPRRIVDLGTGNGLPGVVAALFWPDAETLLVERREKKALAVGRCLERVGLSRVAVLALDGRELLRDRPEVARAVDLVTVRAVGELAPATKVVAPWLARGGLVVHWKADGLDAAERAAGDDVARSARLRPIPDVEFSLPSGARRRLVAYEAP